MTVMSLRITENEKIHILKWAKQEGVDKSNAVRELLEYGWKFVLLERFRHGKISLEFLAEELNITVSEAMDFVAEYGAASSLDYDDYIQSKEAIAKVF